MLYIMKQAVQAVNYVLPALQKSNVIYQFSCHCDSRYVGRLYHAIVHHSSIGTVSGSWAA